jgi:hypothetical protein
MTLLVISRSIEGGHREPDLSPITTPGPKLEWSKWRNEIEFVLKDLRIPLNQTQPSWTEFHPSTKKGPNGQAILTSVNDAHALKEHPQLYQDILTLGNSPVLRKVIEFNQRLPLDEWSKISGNARIQIRKLSAVLDPEAKTRIIAIFDYWSQAVLKPLHDKLMHTLKQLPDDRTYHQVSGFDGVPTSQFWSLDLSNATDRFPLGFQKEVISLLFGDQYSQAWARVMVSQPFTNPWGQPVLYGTGQPMGAYSSWAAFTLSHHILVRIAAKRCGISSKSGNYYQILGDDIVISNDAVAKQYQEMLSELGVGISQSKSHVSQYMFEFAKRWYWNKQEVSGLPIKGILTARQFWWQLLPEMEELFARTGQPHTLVDPRIFSSILKMTGQPRRFATRLYMTSLLLSDKSERITRWQIFLSHFDGLEGCNQPSLKRIKWLEDAIVILQASSLERSLVSLRTTEKEFTLKMNSILTALGLTGPLLPNYQAMIAPIAVIRQLYKEAKDRVQGIKERTYDNDEIVEMARNTLNANPLQLLHQRKKHIRVQAQADLTKSIIEYARTSNDIRRKLLRVHSDQLSELFSTQQGYLPSYARDKVSWSHIEALEARRLRDGY